MRNICVHLREGEGFPTCVGDIGSPLMMPEGGGRYYSQVTMVGNTVMVMMMMMVIMVVPPSLGDVSNF